MASERVRRERLKRYGRAPRWAYRTLPVPIGVVPLYAVVVRAVPETGEFIMATREVLVEAMEAIDHGRNPDGLLVWMPILERLWN